jgi:cytochrome c peroxidase
LQVIRFAWMRDFLAPLAILRPRENELSERNMSRIRTIVLHHRRVVAAATMAILLALAGAVLWRADAIAGPSAPSAAAPEEGLPAESQEPIKPLPAVEPLDAARVRLGAALFVDTRLSRGNARACVSCHDVRTNGAGCRLSDLNRVNAPVGAHGDERLERNVLTVFNSSLNYRQFWDGRVATQQEVVDDVIRNPREMDTTWDNVLAALRRDQGMVDRFHEVYPDGVQRANVQDALATFLRSLRTPNARIDRYLQGDTKALSADELRGYRLFKEYGCVACHQGANIGGNMFQVLGVVRRPAWIGVDAQGRHDWGRYEITHQESDRLVFRVPSLRNVAVRAPYLHDGSAPHLEDAVRVMFEYQLGRNPSPQDVALIVKFLGTLTGEYEGHPLTQPSGETSR